METEYITADKLKRAALDVRRVARVSSLRDDDDPTIESPAPTIPPEIPSPLGDEDEPSEEPSAEVQLATHRRQLVVLFVLSCAAALVIAIAALGRA